MNRIYAMCAALLVVFAACQKAGDNSDYDFGDNFSDTPDGSAVEEGPFADGYGRLPETVRLASYNVHRCTGPNTSVADYDGLAAGIKMIDADVIGLQELDSKTKKHPYKQVEELATRAGMSSQYCKTIDYNGGEYGIGVLYKKGLRIRDTYSGNLPGDEPRKFFFLEFDDFSFICTHFCHKSVENRKKSVDIINDYLIKTWSTYKKPIFLVGDLNCEPGSEEMKKMLGTWTMISARKATFFNATTPKCIDYVLQWNGNNPQTEVLRSGIPQFQNVDFAKLSDHYPVLVDLKSF